MPKMVPPSLPRIREPSSLAGSNCIGQANAPKPQLWRQGLAAIERMPIFLPIVTWGAC